MFERDYWQIVGLYYGYWPLLNDYPEYIEQLNLSGSEPARILPWVKVGHWEALVTKGGLVIDFTKERDLRFFFECHHTMLLIKLSKPFWTVRPGKVELAIPDLETLFSNRKLSPLLARRRLLKLAGKYIDDCPDIDVIETLGERERYSLLDAHHRGDEILRDAITRTGFYRAPQIAMLFDNMLRFYIALG